MASATSPARPDAARTAGRTIAGAQLKRTTATRGAAGKPQPPSPSPTAASIARLWSEYKRTGSEAALERLVQHYLPLVRSQAQRLHTRFPAEVDLNDLAQQGYFGLLDAIESFDPTLGIKFETFCAQRLRGSIFDYLRSIDYVSRGTRARQRRLEQTRRSFYARCGRLPCDEELLELLSPDREEARRILRHGQVARRISLSRTRGDSDSDREMTEIDILSDERQIDPIIQTHKHDLRQYITRELRRSERLILILYYYENMRMKEIGETLDLSESRVSQMHASIIKRLQARLHHREPEFHEP